MKPLQCLHPALHHGDTPGTGTALLWAELCPGRVGTALCPSVLCPSVLRSLALISAPSPIPQPEHPAFGHSSIWCCCALRGSWGPWDSQPSQSQQRGELGLGPGAGLPEHCPAVEQPGLAGRAGISPARPGLFVTKEIGVGGQGGSPVVPGHSICQAEHGETLLALTRVQPGSLDFKSCQCLFLQRCCSRDREEPRELQKRQLISRPCLRNGFNPFSTPTASFILS